MNKLLAKQLKKASLDGQLDKDDFLVRVSAIFDEYDRDRARTDRTITLMIEENEQLNRQLQATITKLAIQNARFAAALENMSHGLCMFDQDDRLVVSNRRYAELFSLTPDLVQPGTPFATILDYVVSHGVLDHVERAKLLAGIPTADSDDDSINRIWAMADSRIIEAVLSRTEDSGWIAICEDVTEQRQAEAQIYHMARHDTLTDLPNRVQFREAMEWHLARTDRGEQVAVMCLDLDHFKAVNDTLGHPIGDKLLISVAERLGDCVRHGDLIARLGGDEFAIIQVGVRQPVAATSLAQRIIDQLSEPFIIEGHQVSIGVSIGVAVAPTNTGCANQLLKYADLALYRAKEDGRSVLRFFEPEMDVYMQARRSLEFDLRQALIKKEFELHYQPLVNISDNKISGFEALLRWNHPERGRVAPDDFIPLSEEIGLIGPIGDWVLMQACLDAVSWPEPFNVAVNLSPAQFKNRSLAAAVIAALNNAGLEPMRLELEITETIMLQNTEHTLAVLSEMRDLGVRISMDDFGTGYSSLSYLRRFPFDKIKIDQTFICDLDKGPDALAIVRAVTGLSKSLGIATTAEGVETAKQLETLKLEGCTEVQGYLFSRPRPASELRELLNCDRELLTNPSLTKSYADRAPGLSTLKTAECISDGKHVAPIGEKSLQDSDD